jgi:hypothetical protein
MRHARPQDHNAITVRTEPVERTLMHAQATAHKPSRGIKDLFEIPETEGRAAPRAESAGSAVPGNQIDGLATVVSAEDDGLNTGGDELKGIAIELDHTAPDNPGIAHSSLLDTLAKKPAKLVIGGKGQRAVNRRD